MTFTNFFETIKHNSCRRKKMGGILSTFSNQKIPLPKKGIFSYANKKCVIFLGRLPSQSQLIFFRQNPPGFHFWTF
uniref:Uncharacterized protein n=1 Tax=viral metagenome TaxID=1070528 RepID=A0A6C0DR33_9ZZZZ